MTHMKLLFSGSFRTEAALRILFGHNISFLITICLFPEDVVLPLMSKRAIGCKELKIEKEKQKVAKHVQEDIEA